MQNELLISNSSLVFILLQLYYLCIKCTKCYSLITCVSLNCCSLFCIRIIDNNKLFAFRIIAALCIYVVCQILLVCAFACGSKNKVKKCSVINFAMLKA